MSLTPEAAAMAEAGLGIVDRLDRRLARQEIFVETIQKELPTLRAEKEREHAELKAEWERSTADLQGALAKSHGELRGDMAHHVNRAAEIERETMEKLGSLNITLEAIRTTIKGNARWMAIVGTLAAAAAGFAGTLAWKQNTLRIQEVVKEMDADKRLSADQILEDLLRSGRLEVRGAKP